MRKKYKVMIFNIIVYLPLSILILMLLSFSYNVFKLNFFDYEETYSNIETTLKINDFKEEVIIKDNKIEFYILLYKHNKCFFVLIVIMNLNINLF